MYLIYNNDGSIKFAITNDYIQQGSNNVNYIDIAIDNYSTSNYTCDCLFTLPNSTTITLAGVVQNFSYSGENYSGYRIWLSSAVLAYAGILRFNIRLYNSTGAILYTYQYEQNVNATSLSTDWDAPITQAQYNSFMSLLTSYINAYDSHLLRKYDTLIQANSDINNLSNNEIVFIKNISGYEFYYKNNRVLTLINSTDYNELINAVSFGLVNGVLTETLTKNNGLTLSAIQDLKTVFYR